MMCHRRQRGRLKQFLKYFCFGWLFLLLVREFLDGQFLPLQELQDEGNPDFVVEVVSLFFDDSKKLLNDLTIAL
ncbi:Uncharacterized protein TCM_018597 [Theobroma cacao]|uniref:Histidine-containing phosphotransfer protein n=1 Tax=Theobroma cacao TaxID=3641 RepID=A0A061EFS0_THECC|nr:Uncharacterized protein TCM_018597 [Theobroma cacao]